MRESTTPRFGCVLGEAIIDWLIIFVQLSVLGVFFLFLSTLGNSTYINEGNRWVSLACVLVSIAVIVVTTILSFAYRVKTVAFSTVKQDQYKPLYISALVCGCLVLLLQITQLARMIFPSGLGLGLSSEFDRLASSAVRLEQQTKRAARYKVNRMVANALACHSSDSLSSRSLLGSTDFKTEKSGSINSLISSALCNYNARLSSREEIGGVWWVLCNYWFGSRLLQQEGVVIFPRLLWSNLGQLFIFIALIYMWSNFSRAVAAMNDPVFEGLSRRR